jgi:hypothetical protein
LLPFIIFWVAIKEAACPMLTDSGRAGGIAKDVSRIAFAQLVIMGILAGSPISSKRSKKLQTASS